MSTLEPSVKALHVILGMSVAVATAQAQTAADRQRVYSVERVDSLEGVTVVPVVLRQPAVVYPDSLKRAGIGGTVRVSVVLNRNGTPDFTSVRVVSSPDTGLNAAARAVVLGTKFIPGYVDGHVVRTLVTLGVLFDPLDTAKAPAPIYSQDDSLTEAPALRHVPRLEYPTALWERRVQGRVVVQMIIDTLGRAEPESVQIITSPDPGFMWTVQQYVVSARFRPARRGGRAVRSIVEVPIDFKLPASPPRPSPRCGVYAELRPGCLP